MQALFVITIVLVALAVLVPMVFMVGALFRTVVATFRSPASGESEDVTTNGKDDRAGREDHSMR